MSMKITQTDVSTKGSGKFTKLLSTCKENKRDVDSAASPVYTEPKNNVNDVLEATEKESGGDRPFTLPPGQFRPKQSLGQNFHRIRIM